MSVVIPDTFKSSNSVCPSTSKFPSTFKFEFASITPFTLTVSLNVEIPATFKVSVISSPVCVVSARTPPL